MFSANHRVIPSFWGPLHVPTNRITQILNGRRDITADTALRLAHFFGTSAEFWINLQSLYDLRIAQQEAGKTIKALPTLKRMTAVHA
ncbi:MAG: HigA family addiction module antitoxin [Terriglobia bacterium]